MTVYRVHLSRSARALVCVEAATSDEARELAAGLVSESEWTPYLPYSEAVPSRKDWPAPDVYWTGDLQTGKWVYPDTTLFEGNET